MKIRDSVVFVTGTDRGLEELVYDAHNDPHSLTCGSVDWRPWDFFSGRLAFLDDRFALGLL
jgi:hypothetical protein